LAKLIIIPTPIGNLSDVSERIKSALTEVDLLLAEDTRHTGLLLKHLDIKQKLMSYHKFNEHGKLESTLEVINRNESVGLVTDAGTPGISDPGFLIIRACVEAGIEVECLPGPVAFIPALVVSGLPCDRFCFEGFIPVKKGRKTRLELLAEEERTLVFYESPHRISRTLRDMAEHFGSDRKASLSREISKKFEETLRGNLKELHEITESRKLKGEMVLVVEGKSGKS
jgi:16S rRNA (cytidine1402-2'-O)-methyltransferase